MTKIAIIYHSGYGHTETQAKSVFEGANSVEGCEAKLFTSQEAIENIDELDNFDAMIFGSPTYMGSVSAKFKEFMEAASKKWLKHEWKDKIAAGFTNSHSLSGDKLNTLIQMSVFAAQHAMIWVGVGDLNQSPDGEPGKIDKVNRLGGFLGAMAQSENDSPENTPPEGDHKTAKRHGERVAKITKKMKD